MELPVDRLLPIANETRFMEDLTMIILNDFLQIAPRRHAIRTGRNETSYKHSLATVACLGESACRIVKPITYLKEFYACTRTFVTTAFAVHRYAPPLMANNRWLATLIS